MKKRCPKSEKKNNMKMKDSMPLTFIVFSILLLSVPLATCDPILDNFVQCLRNHAQPSNSISQNIYTPNNSSFQSVFQAYAKNRRYLTPTTPKPLAVITATHESHAQATVICAKSHDLQIRIRSGGHDYEGLSYVSNVPFIVLDLSNLRSIDIDIASETAWVEAGATLGELYHKIANRSKVHAFPAGACPTLGAGGHISGGGYGNLMRKYGLSVDNIIDAVLVDVNGNILSRKSMGEDLFWAIRGGGGASFGVILAWKINLVRVPATVTVFRVTKTLEQGATDVVYKWQQVASGLDKEIFIRLMPQVVNGSGEGEKTVRVDFIGLFLGQSDALLALINKSFPELGLQRNDCIEMSWVESTVFWAGFASGTSIDVLLNRTGPGQIFFKSKSDYAIDIIPKASLQTIWKNMIKSELNFMQWNPYGGRMNEISATETPYPHRAGYLFKIQYSTGWVQDGVETTNHYLSLMREFHDSMAPYVTKNPREAFQNYRDLDIGSNPSNYTDFNEAEIYGHKYFKDNFLRLTYVKGRVDPDNFFKHEQSIPPSFPGV